MALAAGALGHIATGKVRYVVRNFPVVALHKQAVKAAEATGCAGDQRKLWEMHDRLFAEPTALAVAARGPEELEKALREALRADGPTVIEAIVDGAHYAETVYD
jgi:protein-disulfide isomerase